MITEDQILKLGFEHKTYIIKTGVNDYRHDDYPFLISLHNGSVQIITATNKNDGPKFNDFQELQSWLSDQ